MKYGLGAYHPWTQAVFYAAIILLTVLIPNPVYYAVSLVFALAFALKIKGMGALKYALAVCFPVMCFVVLFNPLFNRRGADILFYIGTNPVTAQAVLYGASNALMLAALLMWFYSYSLIVSSDKFIYLLGGIMPQTALVISMTVRLIPLSRRRLTQIANAQKGIGKGVSTKGFLNRIKNALAILNTLLTLSLESGIILADSMSARGYGKARRRRYKVYRFKKYDVFFIIFCAASFSLAAGAVSAGAASFSFFPVISTVGLTAPLSVLGLGAFASLCFLPVIIEIYGVFRWRYST